MPRRRRDHDEPAPRLPVWMLLAVFVVGVAAVYQWKGGCAAPRDATHERLPPGPAPPIPAPPPPAAAAPAPARPAIDVEGIGDADERAAIVEVARAIDRGGPFAYRKDGTVFGNRERLLPPHPRGHWREYTVPTPGSDDRGARRIVAGRDGELFYTRDHYRTFRRIRGPTR